MADGFFWNEAHAKIAKARRQWYAWGEAWKVTRIIARDHASAQRGDLTERETIGGHV